MVINIIFGELMASSGYSLSLFAYVLFGYSLANWLMAIEWASIHGLQS